MYLYSYKNILKKELMWTMKVWNIDVELCEHDEIFFSATFLKFASARRIGKKKKYFNVWQLYYKVLQVQ